MSHTYVVLDLSQEAFNEISRKLKDAGYHHCFHEDGAAGEVLIDMHGLAVRANETSETTFGSLAGTGRRA